MLTRVQGVYRHGRVELTELLDDLPDEARVNEGLLGQVGHG